MASTLNLSIILHGLMNIIIAGTSEAIATYKALLHLRSNKRPFVLTRSNYPGVGAYAAHWNGELYTSSRPRA